MWENRCKVAVSGVGFSKVTRSAEIPLAAHALTAVQEAVADSGPQDVRHRRSGDLSGTAGDRACGVDGISIVSVNCMMAMLKLPNLSWHIQVGTTNIGGAVQQAVNALARRRLPIRGGVAWRCTTRVARTRTFPALKRRVPLSSPHPNGFGGPGQGMAVAYTRWLERHNQNREEDGDIGRDPAPPHAAQSARIFYGTELTREDYLNSRMVAYPFCLFDCDIPVQGAVAVVLTTADRRAT